MTEGLSVHADLLRTLALGLPGTTEALHFDRRAFRARRIYATVMPTGATSNLYLTPEDQAYWCDLMPDTLSPVPNRWGARGWTEVKLVRIDPADLAVVLRLAWATAGGKDPAEAVRARTSRKVDRS